MNVFAVSDFGNWRPLRNAALSDLTVSSTAVALVPDLDDRCRRVLVTIEDADVRMTFDGSTPTSTHGHEFLKNTVLRLSREMAKCALVIRGASTDAKATRTQCEFANGARE